MYVKHLILASEENHPSFANQAMLLDKLHRMKGYYVIRSDDYLANRQRCPDYDVLILGSPVSERLRFFLQVFMMHSNRRIAYVTCEGPLDKHFYKPSIFQPYKVYANSYFSAKNLMESGITVHGVIHHAVDMDLIGDAMKNPAHLPADDNQETLFTYVGQIGPRKRPELFLEAFRKASRKTGHKIKLITVSGISRMLKPEDHNVIEIASFGSLPYREVLKIISGSHYYLHLTTSEGFGLPALEARCLGKPLVALEMQPTTEFIPKKGCLWVKVTEMRRTKYMGYMDFIEHLYDIDEAADIIAQAHDIRLNYPSQYEDMRHKQLAGAKKYDYRVMYKRFIEE